MTDLRGLINNMDVCQSDAVIVLCGTGTYWNGTLCAVGEEGTDGSAEGGPTITELRGILTNMDVCQSSARIVLCGPGTDWNWNGTMCEVEEENSPTTSPTNAPTTLPTNCTDTGEAHVCAVSAATPPSRARECA